MVHRDQAVYVCVCELHASSRVVCVYVDVVKRGLLQTEHVDHDAV